jgi:hypothetical protein
VNLALLDTHRDVVDGDDAAEPHRQVPKKIINTVIRDKILNVPLSQEKFDSYLHGKSRSFGRWNSCFI